MAFTLIPYPLSVLFILVFVVAAELVLWKLRKNGKSYRMLSNVALAAGVFVLVVLVIAVVLGLQSAALANPNLYPTLSPQPVPPK